MMDGLFSVTDQFHFCLCVFLFILISRYEHTLFSKSDKKINVID